MYYLSIKRISQVIKKPLKSGFKYLIIFEDASYLEIYTKLELNLKQGDGFPWYKPFTK